jgi:hypothetical protein
MGCAVCTIKTPNYKSISILDFYKGESTKCSWQNDANVVPGFKTQVCPPYAVCFNKAQRDLLKLYVRDDGLVYKKNDKGEYILFDTFNVTDEGDPYVGTAIFVMGFDGTLYSSLTYGRNMIMHSSFFSGKPVAAAGEIKAQNGVIQSMNNCSGHYRPTVAETQQAIDSLNVQGYDVDGIDYAACPRTPALPTSGMEPLCNPFSPLCIIDGGEGEDIAE